MATKGLLQRDENGGIKVQPIRISRAEDKEFLDPTDKDGFAYGEQDGGVMRAIPSLTRRGSLERIFNRNPEFNSETGKYDVGPLARITMALEGLTDKDGYKYLRSKVRADQEDNLIKADEFVDSGYSITPSGAKAPVNPDSNAVNYRDLQRGLVTAGELKTEVDKYEEKTGKTAPRELGIKTLKNLNEVNTELSDNDLTRADLGVAANEVVAQDLLNSKIRELVNKRDFNETKNSYREQKRLEELNYNRNVADAVRKRQGLVEDRDFRLSTIQAENEFALAEQQNLLKRAQLDMELEQANLDREYLNTKDQREYDYRQQKDGMEQFDRIMMLILGGTDKLF